MSDQARMFLETGFNVFYLLAVWIVVGLMFRRMSMVREERRPEANLFRWAFFLLALGDTGHVGFRVVAYARGGLQGNAVFLGLGTLATAITVTFFYIIMLYVWKTRFNRSFGWFEYFLLTSAAARFVVMTFPQNEWTSAETHVFWGPFRNSFLIVLGVGVLGLILRDALRAHDRLYTWIAVCILFSYLFYTPVVFWARYFPLLGLLMIPKTVMYLVIAFLAYDGLWLRSISAKPAVLAQPRE